MTAAEARAKALIAEHYRRLQEFAGRIPNLDSEPGRSDPERKLPAPEEGARLPLLEPDRLRAAVSVHAYHKAEQRGFGPGRETDDWLEAERELLEGLSLLDRE